MRLLALAGDIDSLIAEIRLRTPLEALVQRIGWTLTLRSFHDCQRSDLAAADVLIVQRADSRRAWALQRAMRLRGGAVICEIDDLLTEMPAHISNQRATQSRRVWVLRCLAEADAVTAATRRLGDELGLPAAYVVPNHALPLGDLPIPPLDPAQPVSLLFAGMERLATNFIYAPLRALQAQGLALQVVVMGPPGAAFVAAGVAAQCHSLLPRAQFIEFARGLPNPLAVIPLEDSRFAACKSAIKWFEYAEAGIPVLCSGVSPYREVVDDGLTGRLVGNEPAAWQAALEAAVADGPWRQRCAAAARRVVRERHTLAQTSEAWQVAVEGALRRRQDLGPLQAGLALRVQDGLHAVLEAPALRLRQLNRARLARRQRV